MKWLKGLKKYPLLSMIIVSSICVGIFFFFTNKQSDIGFKMLFPFENQPKVVKGDFNENNLEEDQAKIESQTESSTISSNNANTTYDFTKVQPDYFDDALFIGDSRTCSLAQYAGWSNANFYVENGLTIWTVLDDKIVPIDNSIQKMSVDEALQTHSFKKIYLMLGINEMGRGNVDTFFQQYSLVMNRIKELQPDAIIFVEGIMHVTKEKDAEGTYINNSGINERNFRLASLEDNSTIFYIDVNEAVDDTVTPGVLNSEYTFDGVHLKAMYIDVWKQFILDHGIVK